MDFFVGNLGLNSRFQTGEGHSLHIYCDDFDQSGTFDIVLSYLYKDKLVPVKGREFSSQQMPFITEKFPTIKSFAAASLEEIYGREELDHALHYEADLLESVFVENQGNGKFEIKALPVEAQISPVHDFDFLDINGDGTNEVLLVGNMYHTEVETMRLDASYGCILEYTNGRFSAVKSSLSGFSSKGDARDICLIQTGDDQHLLMVANNNEALNIFRFINK
jgi:hypothetical protein